MHKLISESPTILKFWESRLLIHDKLMFSYIMKLNDLQYKMLLNTIWEDWSKDRSKDELEIMMDYAERTALFCRMYFGKVKKKTTSKIGRFIFLHSLWSIYRSRHALFRMFHPTSIVANYFGHNFTGQRNARCAVHLSRLLFVRRSKVSFVYNIPFDLRACCGLLRVCRLWHELRVHRATRLRTNSSGWVKERNIN